MMAGREVNRSMSTFYCPAVCHMTRLDFCFYCFEAETTTENSRFSLVCFILTCFLSSVNHINAINWFGCETAVQRAKCDGLSSSNVVDGRMYESLFKKNSRMI